MLRYRNSFPVKLLKPAFGLVSVFLPSMVMAAAVGLYSGTFDPPTEAQLGIIRCVLGDASLPRKCQEIGQKILRLVVLVNKGGETDTLASARERVLMVEKALEKYGDRVEVVALTAAQREERKRALLTDKNIAQLVQFFGHEFHETWQSARANQDPRLLWVVLTLATGAKPFSQTMEPKKITSATVQNASRADAMARLVEPSTVFI